MKRSIMSRFRPWQDEFDHRYACWSINHGGWRKMKKLHRKLSKRKFYKEDDREREDQR